MEIQAIFLYFGTIEDINIPNLYFVDNCDRFFPFRDHIEDNVTIRLHQNRKTTSYKVVWILVLVSLRGARQLRALLGFGLFDMKHVLQQLLYLFLRKDR